MIWQLGAAPMLLVEEWRIEVHVVQRSGREQ